MEITEMEYSGSFSFEVTPENARQVASLFDCSVWTDGDEVIGITEKVEVDFVAE